MESTMEAAHEAGRREHCPVCARDAEIRAIAARNDILSGLPE